MLVLIEKGYARIGRVPLGNLTGQVALITGGGRGLGRDFAIALARAGMRIAIIARTPEQVNETVATIRSERHQAIGLIGDVTDKKFVDSAVSAVLDEFGAIDLLINNAGSITPLGSVQNIDTNRFKQTIDVNLIAPILLYQAVVPGMIARGSGRIINLASSTMFKSELMGLSAYALSKISLVLLSNECANELKGTGVKVFAVHPGSIRTDLSVQLLNGAANGTFGWYEKIFANGLDNTSGPGIALITYIAEGLVDHQSGSFFLVPRRRRRGTPEIFLATRYVVESITPPNPAKFFLKWLWNQLVIGLEEWMHTHEMAAPNFLP